MSKRALIAALALASCYRPSVAPCQYHCAADGACPDGLVCNPQLGGMCVSAADPMCSIGGSGTDGGRTSDAITGDVLPSSCKLFGSATAMLAPNGAPVHSIAPGDLDHDGYLDAVVASELPEIGIDFGEPELISYQAYEAGSGDAVFQAVPFSLGSGSDSNGIAYSYVAGGVSYVTEEFFAAKMPAFSLASVAGTGTGNTPIAFAVGAYDVPTPSITDVVTSPSASEVFTYGNTSTDPASDQFSFHYISSALPPAITAVFGNVDPDTQTDVVLVYKSGAQVLYDPYRPGPDPSGSDNTSLPMSFPQTAVAAALVDLGTAGSTGRGLDLVIATTDGLLVGYNQSSGTSPFGSALSLVSYPMAPGGIATGDFDRDGYQDVIVTDGGSDLVVFEGLPDGSFKEPLPISLASEGLTLSGAIAAGDFTNDGVPDLAVAIGASMVMLPDVCGSGS